MFRAQLQDAVFLCAVSAAALAIPSCKGSMQGKDECKDTCAGNGASGPSGGLSGASTPPECSGLCSEDGGGADSKNGIPGNADGSPELSDTHPNILFNNSEFKARLTSSLKNKRPSAARIQGIVDGQLAGADYYGYEEWLSALMYQVTGEKHYCEHAVEITEAFVASEENLIKSGQRPFVARDSYLYVGEHIGNLALVYDWCHDLLSQAQRKRWTDYANQSIWNVWNHPKAFWGDESEGTSSWSGWSTDNPLNNYYYSFLRATMLWGLASNGENSEAKKWIDHAREKKLGDQLFPQFAKRLAGGGSPEGTGYGTAQASLFDIMEFWQSSTGEDLSQVTSHPRDSMVYMLHAIVPTREFIAPIGDHARDSTAAFFDYHRHYLMALAWMLRTDPLAGAAKVFLEKSPLPQMQHRFRAYADYFYDLTDVPATDLGKLATLYYAPGTGHVFGRSSWTDSDATWFNFIAGPFSESHAHADQGSLMIFKRGWMAYDSNFHARSGIIQTEQVHNLLYLEKDGEPIPQRRAAYLEDGSAPPEAAKLVALKNNVDFSYMLANIAPVYSDSDILEENQREVVYLKPNVFLVFDRVETNTNAGEVLRRVQWTTPATPEIDGNVATVENQGTTMRIHKVFPSKATLSTYDMTESPLDDFSAGHRVDIQLSEAGASRFLTVIHLDDTLTNVGGSETDGALTANLGFADGATARVTFGKDAPGAHIEWQDSSGKTRVDDEVCCGVDTGSVWADE
jgi:hypothetical protein